MPQRPRRRVTDQRPQPSAPPHKTSWEGVSDWYADYLAKPGTLQADVVFPGVIRLLNSAPSDTHLDLACGEGSFADTLLRHAPLTFTGFDASPSLVQKAQQRRLPNARFMIGDATRFAQLYPTQTFDSASCILAIQNIQPLAPVFLDLAKVLTSGGRFVLVMNHPYFRQPKQSEWGWDDARKIQYRRVDRYAHAYEVPIVAHPGAAPSVKTYSYHRPLTVYVNALAAVGFTIDAMEEWSSNKVSDSGPRAKAENIAREEIPLFLALRARKI